MQSPYARLYTPWAGIQSTQADKETKNKNKFIATAEINLNNLFVSGSWQNKNENIVKNEPKQAQATHQHREREKGREKGRESEREAVS